MFVVRVRFTTINHHASAVSVAVSQAAIVVRFRFVSGPRVSPACRWKCIPRVSRHVQRRFLDRPLGHEVVNQMRQQKRRPNPTLSSEINRVHRSSLPSCRANDLNILLACLLRRRSTLIPDEFRLSSFYFILFYFRNFPFSAAAIHYSAFIDTFWFIRTRKSQLATCINICLK